MKRKNIVLICIGVLVLALIAYLVVVMVTTNHKGFVDSDGSTTVVAMRQSSIAEMEYEIDDTKYDFYQNTSGDWIYKYDPEFPINPKYMSAMTEVLSKITSSRTITPDEDADFESFGLSDPALSIKVTDKGGNEYNYKVGAYNNVTGEFYFQKDGDENVYLVPVTIVQIFSFDLFEMATLDAPPVIDDENIMSYDIVNGGEKTVEVSYIEDPSEYNYSDGYYQWFITYPYETTAGNTMVVKDLLHSATELSTVKCVDYKADDAALAQYGLSDPITAVNVNYRDKKTVQSPVGAGTSTVVEEKTFTLSIGKEYDDTYTYVRLGDSDLVCLAKTQDTDKFKTADPHACLPNEVFLMDYWTVDSMTVTLDGVTYDVRKEVTRTGDVAGEENKKVTYTINGKEADGYYVDEMYNSLLNLKREDLATKEITEKPYMTIRFLRNTENFSDMTLTFTKYDSSFYVVGFDGRQELLVNKRDVESIAESFKKAII